MRTGVNVSVVPVERPNLGWSGSRSAPDLVAVTSGSPWR